jgi:hypothetical protein
VIGGVREKLDDNKTGPFVVKKVVVVEDRHLGALFRRDEYLRSLVCRLEDTTEALTPGLFFSELISK